uniref:Ribonuclease A-domain domain-containing protein n=1 Tax=Oreochromis aureus TaxID=47969 RepID=A0AAZ1Y5T6_OREAU
MEIFVCLLLGLISAVELCASLDFYQKHVIGNMLEYECATINQRGIGVVDGKCKTINTFILTKKAGVNRICAGHTGQRQGGNFQVVECRHDGNSVPPNCIFWGELHNNRMIDIQCDHGLPVHFNTPNNAQNG